jgi:hypothetical protein
MEGGKAKRNYARDFVISFSIALGLFLLIHSRIVKAPNGRMLVWGWESRAWAVFPKTIRMAEGEISVKPFTKVTYYENDLGMVEVDRRQLAYSLRILDNTIDQGLILIMLGPVGFRTERETPISFKFDNFIFKVSEYEHRAYFEDKNDNDKRDADEELFYERTLFINDFDEIVLADNTAIRIGSRDLYYVFKAKKDEWEMFCLGSRSAFFVTNSAWKEHKNFHSIVFEPNWGKVIRYREVENPYL